jgi:hypothetical protein
MFMLIGRVIGYLLILAALIVLVAEVIDFVATGNWTIISTGDVWYRIDPSSLAGAQSGIEQNIADWLWDPVIATLLRVPAWVFLGLSGMLLAAACRRPHDRRSRSRHRGLGRIRS